MSRAETNARERETDPEKNSLGLWVGLAGLASLIVGLFIGFSKDTDCGSPFVPDSSGAQLFDAIRREAGFGISNTAADCAEELAGPTAAAWAFTLGGAVLIVLGIVLANVLNRTKESAPSVGQSSDRSPSERLAALNQAREAGLITEDEYQTKRSKVIEEL
ncbi:SHOCT domain-containing protein [Micrococcus sp. TA1]|uniref:SHOCT domain-containing protein n=1 Tax=Micrococcus sp. TA1 TaxID=681627 RepID=UPI001617B0BD|nr:SHOCT domain-containing protein [Micrococcus sp. TA1]MBB5747939.1 hypothetical protein [Micrococcus sp. TA1]